jgi:hypothetical protein
LKLSMTIAILALAGCGWIRGADPVAVCAAQAHDNGPDVRVVGAFATTVSKVRELTPGIAPARWPDLPGESAAVVCFLDGAVPKAPPGGEPYDRAVIAVSGEHAELIIAGHREHLPVAPP